MTSTIENLYSDLKKIGTCDRCCLRLLGEKFANYENPEKTIEDLFANPSEDIKIKKLKTNPCIVCLGLLEPNFQEEVLNNECWKELQIYDTSDYKLNLNLPGNILLRNKAITLYIKQKFPEIYEAKKLNENILPINLVFKYAFKKKFEDKCGKKHDSNSSVQLWLKVYHDENDKDMDVMKKLENNFYMKRNYNGEKTYGKNAINNILSEIEETKFTQHVSVPPKIPTNPVKIISVSFETSPVYIAGRYCKFSRKLSQTPWNFENECDRKIHGCIQDIIFDGINKTLGLSKEKMTFSASGREDADVRCIGSGRPFYVKTESLKRSYSDELFRKLEATINNNPDLSVFDLQTVDKTALKEVKKGEEMKRKGYIALCFSKDTICVHDIVKKINEFDCSQFFIDQKTPIRVSHRRTLSTRRKQIFKMEAECIEGHDNIFQLTLLTEAGTYVKEFINGDFGRTSPCLTDLIQANVDIFRLDVIGIDLDWPKHINSIPHPAMLMSSDISYEKAK